MPTLGRPSGIDANNPYKKIKKYQGSNNNFSQLKEMADKGEYLNRIAGNKKMGENSVKIVDGTQHERLGKEGFLRLLMHQLSNQDPLKPVDQNKMAADLAQFSQLEQMSNMNKNLEKSLADNIIKKKFFAASFLGKKVMTRSASVKHHGEGSTATINFKVPQAIERGFVRIFDQKRQMIAQIPIGQKSAGSQSVLWDGKQLDGQDAGKGIYTFDVKTWDRLNNQVVAQTHAEGVVAGVDFDQYGEPIVIVDGKKVYLRDVQSFHLPQDKQIHSKAYQKIKEQGMH